MACLLEYRPRLVASLRDAHRGRSAFGGLSTARIDPIGLTGLRSACTIGFRPARSHAVIEHGTPAHHLADRPEHPVDQRRPSQGRASVDDEPVAASQMQPAAHPRTAGKRRVGQGLGHRLASPSRAHFGSHHRHHCTDQRHRAGMGHPGIEMAVDTKVAQRLREGRKLLKRPVALPADRPLPPVLPLRMHQAKDAMTPLHERVSGDATLADATPGSATTGFSTSRIATADAATNNASSIATSATAAAPVASCRSSRFL